MATSTREPMLRCSACGHRAPVSKVASGTQGKKRCPACGHTGRPGASAAPRVPVSEVPAELLIDPPSRDNDWRWTWSICQPDACWGEWEAGRGGDREDALRRGRAALARIHRQQGFDA